VGKHRTTVAREVARGSGGRGHRVLKGDALRPAATGRRAVYRARVAQSRAVRRGRRPKPCKLVGEFGVVVAGLLQANWSPQQIAALLPVLFPDRQDWRVSHETIYQLLFVQTRGELRRELTKHLRTQRTGRKTRGHVERRGRLAGMVSIRERPAEAADRAVPGHWEGDLLLGGVGKGAVITLVERSTRFVLLAPLPDTHTSIDLRQTLTPMIAQIAIDAGIEIYFCDPHSPWQRGSNENTNGLLRQYWPKGHDMRHLTQADCNEVALSLNTRPRQTLGWQTPQQALDKVLRATAA
jgi:transposase, IS30 family